MIKKLFIWSVIVVLSLVGLGWIAWYIAKDDMIELPKGPDRSGDKE